MDTINRWYDKLKHNMAQKQEKMTWIHELAKNLYKIIIDTLKII